MLNVKVVEADSKLISGMRVRTTNKNEFNPVTAKIAPLCQRFDETVSVDYANGARVYSVYYDYESDAHGEFSVLIGTDQVAPPSSERLEEIMLPAGKYLVFDGSGEMPQAVIDTWTKVWDYFSQDDAKHQRAYNVDYEHYTHQNGVQLYISIK